VAGRHFDAGGSLYAYEFPSAAALEKFRDGVSPDGSMLPLPGGHGAVIVEWSSPNLYGAGRVLAIYFGHNDSTRAALRRIMGARFAPQPHPYARSET
jgi:hypothetical protein